MKISEEERHEAAGRLREVYTYEEEIEPFVTCDMCHAFDYALGRKFCEEAGDCRRAEYAILNILADFIDAK